MFLFACRLITFTRFIKERKTNVPLSIKLFLRTNEKKHQTGFMIQKNFLMLMHFDIQRNEDLLVDKTLS